MGGHRVRGSLQCEISHQTESAVGLVSRVAPVQTAVRNCTRDEGRPFGSAIRSLIPTGYAIDRATGAQTKSGRYSFCSKRRHTAHGHLIEGRIYYRFHPRCGETVLIARQLEYRGVELVVVLQPDSSLACIPAWMTRGAAAQYTLSDKPQFSVDILRSL